MPLPWPPRARLAERHSSPPGLCACVRMVGAVKYLLWANLILNLVNILPTLIISIVLNVTR